MMPEGDNQGPRDALRPNPTAKRSPRSADDVSRLAHELSSLLDGSIRWLALADRRLAESESDPIDEARKQLDTVRTALVRMADLVHAALKSRHLSLGSPMLGRAIGTNLEDAVGHACEVLRPRAEEMGISIEINMDSKAASVPCGALYSVILNGLSNAVDSIEQGQDIRTGGVVHVVVRLGEPLTDKRRRLEIEIIDDGAGVPEHASLGQVFEPGFSTRTGPRGIGLAVCRSIVEELGGTISLTGRPDYDDEKRPGACLRLSCPEPDDGSRKIGGGT